MGVLRVGLSEVSDDLNRHFAEGLEDSEAEDGYAAKMFGFVGRVKSSLPALADRLTMTEAFFSEVLVRYDEDPKTTSPDFFGYLNQFLASWKVGEFPPFAICLWSLAKSVASRLNRKSKPRMQELPSKKPQKNEDMQKHVRRRKKRTKFWPIRLRTIEMVNKWTTYFRSCAWETFIALQKAVPDKLTLADCRGRVCHLAQAQVYQCLSI
jgi:hypothetical protein